MADFTHPSLVWGPRSGGPRQNFEMKLTPEKLEGWWKLRDPSLNRFWLIHPCDRQTDRQTELPWHVRAIAYMLSRVKRCQVFHKVEWQHIYQVVGSLMINSKSVSKPTCLNLLLTTLAIYASPLTHLYSDDYTALQICAYLLCYLFNLQIYSESQCEVICQHCK